MMVEGVVLSQPVSSTTPSMGLARIAFLHIHAGQVTEQHGSGVHHGFAQRSNGKLQGKTTCFYHAAFYYLRQVAQMAVAGRKLAPRITNTDHRFVHKIIVWITPAYETMTGVQNPSYLIFRTNRRYGVCGCCSCITMVSMFNLE